ncbi:class I SAM-dependent methyltransferase [Phormidium sp. CCY1219]|uniref:class I SAM-dependent methyltransferase n=1 Tax=Phormidium sp. CCY1219 TaxID=2886104 RepID=UPI002D1F5AFC|nr:methyltransferase domain-containing protein [Phormidium sp. CCY1219]MEB3830086.1 methyltransferase domain-containing protein [Phormidium sp. CCY1219]
MTTDNSLILEVIPSGKGDALDLGGGRGKLREPLEKLGYSYINLDTRKFDNGEPTIVGDAHAMPFENASFDLVISKDTLEHFLDPFQSVKEVYRILKPGGLFIIWVPWMHPFHGDDYWRYSPLGLQHLLNEFEIISFDSPLWVFTVVGSAVTEAAKRLGFQLIEQLIKAGCNWLDRRFTQNHNRPAAFAYRLVTRKPGQSNE